MDGLLRCSRYAFGPNRLHYCGPDANHEIFSYIKEGSSDPGLEIILRAFRTMYPYLLHIAQSNYIQDPFSDRVVEAYWIGNELLDTIDKKKFYRHLLEDQKIEKQVGLKAFGFLKNKIRQGAVPHHSFHVLNVWRRTGHVNREHTFESVDQCRVSWGTISSIDGPFITVKIQPLIYSGKKLSLGEAISKTITRNLDAVAEIDELKIGDIVTIHWGVVCEKISEQQALMLKKYTNLSLHFANQTI